jgi:hypothetical protein
VLATAAASPQQTGDRFLAVGSAGGDRDYSGRAYALSLTREGVQSQRPYLCYYPLHRCHMTHTAALRTELSRRIRAGLPSEWVRFTELWLAFNSLYGGEPDSNERARVKNSIRKYISEVRARAIITQTDGAITRILTVPPGNMLFDQRDPKFRRTSRQLARTYKTASKSAVDRLAAASAILYQVRCNLLHGAKDPQAERDRMLVRESVRVLEALVPEVEHGASHLSV